MGRLSTFIAVASIVLCSSEAQSTAAQDVHNFDVPAQPAEMGIATFALQAERQILAPGEGLYGLRTNALRGLYDTKTGLAELLKGIPLSVLSDDGHIIVLGVAETKIAVRLSTYPFSEENFEPETIVVTGYRASLANATLTKKYSISFTDSIFAEDMGKFPDSNIAESVNRIPGISLNRDANGEGIQVAIRGLSTSFTKILLNDAPISLASGGVIDSSNSNREVDLNVFPGELFTQISVTKSARAEILEGGAAGTVNLRTHRPFDNPGAHLSYTLQSATNSLTNGSGANGAVIFSDTWDTHTLVGEIGLLVGGAGRKSYQYSNGWEDGNGGWVTPSITNATQCGAASGCDISGSTVSIGGDAMIIPATVPTNVAVPGYPSGTTVNADMLLALNPGLTMTQISNMLLPRLPRPMYERGFRDGYNVLASLEMQPNESLHAYLDFLFSRQFRRLDRSDLSLGVRAGNGAQPIIPADVTLDSHGIVQTATLYNAQFALEARDYRERFDFFTINPGISWQPEELFSVSLQFNASRSHYFRDTPTIFLTTCPSSGNPTGIPGCTAPVGGVVATFDNTGKIPVVTTNIDLDDPNNFQWYGGRATLMFDRRYTASYGAHFDLAYGGEEFRLKVGAAYDDAFRSIVGIDRTGTWQSNVCQNGSNGACAGRLASLIPQSKLATYLKKGPEGFVTVDYDRFEADSGYNEQKKIGFDGVPGLCVHQPEGAGFASTTAAGATSGCFDERTTGLYTQIDGAFHIVGQALLYDAGLRWVMTRQEIRSPVKRSNGDYDFSTAVHTYQAFLPSLTLSYEVIEDVLFRASFSRTMTRANVTQMVQQVNFSDFNAQSVTLGNPELKPYFSNNIDFGMDVYTGHEGYVSLALFRKDISGFSVSQIVSQPFSYLAQFGITWTSLSSVQKNALTTRSGCTSDSDCTATLNVTQQVNAPGVETIDGLEVTYVQPLDLLLTRYGLKGFGVTGNATVIGQSSSGSAAVHATGVAPYSLNLTGYYENDGLMARLSYTYRDRTYGSSSNFGGICLPTIQASSEGCPEGAYTFNAPYGQADFSSSLQLSKIFGTLPSDPQFIFSVQNLLNAKQFTYLQYKQAADRYYRTGQTFMIGLHGAF